MPSNKDIAWSYYDLLNQHRTEEAIAVLHDDGSFWNVRTRASTPTRDQKEYIRSVMGDVPMQFTLRNAVEEGDQVVLELSSHGVMDDGWVYANEYCFVISIRDGKIFDLREYLDTKHAQDMIDRRS